MPRPADLLVSRICPHRGSRRTPARTAARFLVVTVTAAHLAALAVRLGVAWAGRAGRPQTFEAPHHDPPAYTVMGPLRREAGRVETWLRAVEALKYPRDRLQVLLVVEEDDAPTRAAARQACARRGSPAWLRVVVVPPGGPRTKPRALTHALGQATGELVVVYDAEDAPDPDQLRAAAARFLRAGPDLACLQARLEIRPASGGTRERLMAAEYDLWHGAVLPGLARLGAPVPLGGTSNHLRADALRRLGGWDAANLAEDADLGLRLARAGLRTDVLASVTVEDGTPPGLAAWTRQRARWSGGFAQTWWAAVRTRRLGGARFALTAHGVVAGSLVLQLTTPLLAGVALAGAGRTRRVALATAGVSVLARTGALVAAGRGRPWPGWAALLAPAYLVLEGAAAWRGMWDLVRRPGHWHLTAHPGAKDIGT